MLESTALRWGSRAVPPGAGALAGAAYVALYVAFDWLSYVDPMGRLGITPWNPPPGLSLFVLLRLGPGMAPWLFAAALTAQLVVRGFTASWLLVVLACVILAVGYTLLGALLRRRLGGRSIDSLRHATLFTASVVPATLAIACCYVGLFAVAGTIPAAAFIPNVVQFWIGDLIGIVVTTPLLLAATRGGPARNRGSSYELALQIVAVGISLWIVVGSGAGAQLKLFYVLFPPLIWVAMRRGTLGTAAATLVIQIGLIAALLLEGHQPGEVLDFQFFMLVLAFTGLFLSVAIEERRNADEKLRDKQFELDRTLRAAAASEVASTLAHELNQPLSAIASYTRSCKILLDKGDPDGELPGTMGKVVAEVNRAGTVVHRLRDFVRSGSLEQQSIRPAALLNAARDAVQARALRHGIAIEIDTPDDVPAVWGDRIQLETVLLNLTTNAIDTLAAWQGERTLRLAATPTDDEQMKLTVCDTGPGIAPDLEPHLFQPLATRKPTGMGLGLAISRTIVEAHGGRLWLEPSKAGACFSLTLPTTRSPQEND